MSLTLDLEFQSNNYDLDQFRKKYSRFSHFLITAFCHPLIDVIEPLKIPTLLSSFT